MDLKQCENTHVVFLMPQEKFTQGFTSFVAKFFDPSRITHILYGPARPGYVVPDCENVIQVDSWKDALDNPSCRERLDSCDLIIVNWVEFPLVIRMGKYLNKTILLFWGGDLYHYLKPNGLKAWVKRALLSHVIRTAHGVATLVPKDLEILESISKKHGSWHLIVLNSSTLTDFDYSSDSNTDSVPVKILVGNSATQSNRHVMAFRLLEHLKDEPIEVYAPLSYGDMDCANEVISVGEGIFGEKFKPILEYMDKREYFTFLRSVDIGVFCNDRQQGLGNITHLLRTGGKVFVPKDSAVRGFYEALGCKLYYSEDIAEMSFSEFRELSEDIAEANRDAVSPESLENYAVGLWEELLADEGINGIRK